VHSAEEREELLLPEIECQQKLGKEVVFRFDAQCINDWENDEGEGLTSSEDVEQSLSFCERKSEPSIVNC